MADIVKGLFGVDPTELVQQRNLNNQAMAKDLYGQDPLYGNAYRQIYSGAGGMLGAAAPMLGIKDAGMEQAQNREQLRQQMDLSTPQGAYAAATLAKDRGDMELATNLVQYARQAEVEQKKNALTEAQTQGAMDDVFVGGSDRGEGWKQNYNKITKQPVGLPYKDKGTSVNVNGAGGKADLISTAQGVVRVSPDGSSRLITLPDGTPIIKVDADPTLSGDKKEAQAIAAETAKARVLIPRAKATIPLTLNMIDKMIGSEDGKIKPHKGFSAAVGLGSGAARFAAQGIGGTDAGGFVALENQLKGGAFLEAFNALKGGGQITEVEGQKATQAMQAMDNATTEQEYITAAMAYRKALETGLKLLQDAADGGYKIPKQNSTPSVATFVRDQNGNIVRAK